MRCSGLPPTVGSGLEEALSPSPVTSALRQHGVFDASEHCRSLRRTDASRVAGYDWSGVSPPPRLDRLRDVPTGAAHLVAFILLAP
jgi:hypothetical protein